MVRLCYEKDGYIFILTIDDSLMTNIKTRILLGRTSVTFTKMELDVVTVKSIPMVPFDVYRMYQIPDMGKRIHLNVPISQMDWIAPTVAELSVIIYVEG